MLASKRHPPSLLLRNFTDTQGAVLCFKQASEALHFAGFGKSRLGAGCGDRAARALCTLGTLVAHTLCVAQNSEASLRSAQLPVSSSMVCPQMPLTLNSPSLDISHYFSPSRIWYIKCLNDLFVAVSQKHKDETVHCSLAYDFHLASGYFFWCFISVFHVAVWCWDIKGYIQNVCPSATFTPLNSAAQSFGLSSAYHQWIRTGVETKSLLVREQASPKMPSPCGSAFICLWSGMQVYQQRIPAPRQMCDCKCSVSYLHKGQGRLPGWWDSEFISRVPEFPQGLLFKGKLVCLQLDPWATFDSCSKNNKTDGQNRFWGLHPNCHPLWSLKEAEILWGELLLPFPLCSAFHSPQKLSPQEDGNCHPSCFPAESAAWLWESKEAHFLPTCNVKWVALC